MAKVYLENDQDETEITEQTETLITECINKVLDHEKCGFDAEVSVTIVDSNEIKALNKEHRNKDTVTDVLSFPILEFDENRDIVNSEYDFDGNLVVLGDIVICAERAKEQAEEYGHSFVREIAFLTVHSMLHLLGYDHENNTDMEQIMFKKQEEILSQMGIIRDK